MSDVPVIILTKDENLHLGRCLERWRDLNPPPIRWRARLLRRARGRYAENRVNERHFCIRYFLKLGFLDGLPGYIFASGK